MPSSAVKSDLRSCLILVVGPSHVGKSTLAKSIESDMPGNSLAIIDVDEVLLQVGPPSTTTLIEPGPWIESTYNRLEQLASGSLFEKKPVIVSATFTYVPPGAESASWLAEQYERFLQLATRKHAVIVVVRLTAPLETLLRRRELTGRITPGIVEAIYRTYETSPPLAFERRFAEVDDARAYILKLIRP